MTFIHSTSLFGRAHSRCREEPLSKQHHRKQVAWPTMLKSRGGTMHAYHIKIPPRTCTLPLSATDTLTSSSPSPVLAKLFLSHSLVSTQDLQPSRNQTRSLRMRARRHAKRPAFCVLSSAKQQKAPWMLNNIRTIKRCLPFGRGSRKSKPRWRAIAHPRMTPLPHSSCAVERLSRRKRPLADTGNMKCQEEMSSLMKRGNLK